MHTPAGLTPEEGQGPDPNDVPTFPEAHNDEHCDIYNKPGVQGDILLLA